MGLIEDAKSATQIWGTLSPLGKVLLLGGFVTSALSVGSLADATFKYRGFLSVGIEFYRTVANLPFDVPRLWFDLELPQPQVDAICMGTLLGVAFYRTHRSIEPVERSVLSSILPATLVVPTLWGITLSTTFLVIMIPPVLLLSFATLDKLTRKTRYKFSGPVQVGPTLGYVVAVYLTVAVVAAISEGLTRV